MNKYFKYFTVFLAVTLMFNCEQDDSSELSNYVGFEQGPRAYTVDNGATQTFEVAVAASETTSSDRTYTVIVDDASTLASPYTVPSTVTIPGGSNVGSISITVTDNDDLSFVSQSLILDFSDEVGMDFGNPLTLNFTETCLDTIVSLELTFDAYAEECVWEIYDLSGTPTVVQTGGSGSEYDDLDNSTISFDFCLPSGNYGIVVYDLYGDGGTSYTVTSGGATLASGSTPDAGGGYPVTTQDSATYTVN
ncbi:hypothetical protein [Winogradskyella marincola]|uniref:Calx-beta domain-containing protein n=1 Tax=Winogradskyella marincola TaxID=3037795 RepID=A0ABT6G3R9_9FLAO|nr:hypothetical protein [Winogradskyella sp. YYF002]MDG4716690.1 hypothetical protein [Winogradskyella sp. YYF002]